MCLINGKGMGRQGEAAASQRLFFALWPSDEVRSKLVSALGKSGSGESGLRAGESGADGYARPVRRENLHMTLLFLGNLRSHQRACIERMAARIRGEPFELVLDLAGYWRRSQTLWLGTSRVPVPLQSLVNELREKQRHCGLSSDVRPWRAHVTLARKVKSRPESLRCLQPVHWPVDHFALMETHVHPGGGVHYQVLESLSMRT